jgi:hypothetical protein
MRGRNQRRRFEGCSSLSSISVDALNTCYKVADRILFSKDGKALMCYPASKVSTVYIIPGSVTAIEDAVFEGCGGLSAESREAIQRRLGDRVF